MEGAGTSQPLTAHQYTMEAETVVIANLTSRDWMDVNGQLVHIFFTLALIGYVILSCWNMYRIVNPLAEEEREVITHEQMSVERTGELVVRPGLIDL
jgi:hypothetical protein